MDKQREETSASVPTAAKQAEEIRRRAELGELAEPCVWTERMQTTLIRGVRGGKWFSLIDKVCAMQTLRRAWELVQANDGACGVDNISIGLFSRDAERRLERLRTDLLADRYEPQSVRRKWIDKPGGNEQRPLGIPTVRDRIVQTAVRMVIEPIFEVEFSGMSYGFRPGRSCKDALREVHGLLKAGHVWVLDADLKSYFDTISHQKLMGLVEERISDGRVLALLWAFLQAEILDETNSWRPEAGTPQGAVISPLLANIYLNELDHRMTDAGYRMIRYADDFVVLCRSEAQAHAALAEIVSYADNWDLKLHPAKTQIVDARLKGEGFDFLGYHFERGHKVWPTEKSVNGLRDKVRPKTKRTNGTSMEAIVSNINPILRGWYGYFKHSNRASVTVVDGWVRGRLRSILRKRSKRKGRSRGLDHHRWPNQYFHDLGLFSLEQAFDRERLSLLRANY